MNANFLSSARPILLGALFFFAVLGPAAQAGAQDNPLPSPIYVGWNTFLDTSSFLELVATGTSRVSAVVTLYRSDGTAGKSIRYKLEPKTQVDIDLSNFITLRDQYGVLEITYNDSNAGTFLQGRMSVYLPDDNGSYRFVYTRELSPALTGASFVPSNTIDPQNRNYLVPNWLEVINLDDNAQQFTHNLYDFDGSLLGSTTFTLASKGRRDLEAGLSVGESLYLNEIIPANTDAEYLANLTRYATESTSFVNDRYVFAMPIQASGGTGDNQFLYITNQEGDCWEETNWVEIVNVSSSTISVDTIYRDLVGNQIDSSSDSIPAKGQRHFNASAVLAARGRTIGSIEVETNTNNSLFVQSSIYYHDCRANVLQSGYALPPATAQEAPIVGSFNRFLDLENTLIVLNTIGSATSYDLTLREMDSTTPVFGSNYNLGAFSGTTHLLSDEDEFFTQADTVGTVVVDANRDDALVGYNVRRRFKGENGQAVDFVLPTLVR